MSIDDSDACTFPPEFLIELAHGGVWALEGLKTFQVILILQVILTEVGTTDLEKLISKSNMHEIQPGSLFIMLTDAELVGLR